MKTAPCMMRAWARLLISTLVMHALAAHFACATELLLAKSAQLSIDPSAYLVSEKLDGIRARWDGERLWFRSGHLAPAPAWFVERLPKQALDGELWLGRGQFEAVSSIVRSSTGDWRKVLYVVFELPDAPGTFAQRARKIEELVAAAGFPQLRAAEQAQFANNAALQQHHQHILALGGEGLMLHLASAPYQTGRSDVLLKYKSADDAEATVTEHLPGKGQFLGLLGAIEVRTRDGIRFRIGTGFTLAERKAPPAIGSLITFRYRGLTRHGKPRFASYLRLRNDP